MRSPWARLETALAAPVDIAWLVAVRIAFGSLMAIEAGRFLANGWVHRYFVAPDFYFTYAGFHWISPGPEWFMYALFVGLCAIGIAVAAGLAYRVSSVLLWLGWTYVFLLDKTNYLNHLYLICLVAFLLACMPAHRAGSIDASWRLTRPGVVVPSWTLWLMRFQLGVVYFYGGVAKLNGDWLLRAQPMRLWLPEAAFPLLDGSFEYEATAWFVSYAGLLLDLLVVPFLLWRRTRVLAFAAIVAFHLMNAQLWTIGIFPWLAIALTTIFFDPGWPRQVLARWIDSRPTTAGPPPAIGATTTRLIAIWVLVQAVLPLRHWLYSGNVSWTEEGHRFAWHMKLRDKQAEIGFFVRHADDGILWPVNPAEHLTRRQLTTMATHPDMILQFAHHLASLAAAEGRGAVEVQACGAASLNGRPAQPLVDPAVDLAAVPPRPFVGATDDWITTLGSVERVDCDTWWLESRRPDRGP